MTTVATLAHLPPWCGRRWGQHDERVPWPLDGWCEPMAPWWTRAGVQVPSRMLAEDLPVGEMCGEGASATAKLTGEAEGEI